MDSSQFCEDLGGLVERRAQASDESNMMDLKRVDLSSEIDQMMRNINYYKSKLQSCREKYEKVEMEISDVKRLQCKTLFELQHVQVEEHNLRECLKRIHLDHKACVEKSGGYEDPDERIRATINELTTQRSTLMQELTQLKRNTESNCRKLDRVNAIITEQEEKNKALLQQLMEKSGNNAFIPQDTRRRINVLLKHLERDKDDNATAKDTIDLRN